MMRRALGEWGERLAEHRLVRKGYTILDRNWRAREGEIDLVAREGETIVFVEVKARRSDSLGFPEEAITHGKKSRLIKAAWLYLKEHDLLDAAWRIDVVAIEGSPAAGLRRFEHYVNAVDGQADLER